MSDKICKQGHDMWVTGKLNNGWCKACRDNARVRPGTGEKKETQKRAITDEQKETQRRAKRICRRRKRGAVDPSGDTSAGACQICGTMQDQLCWDHSHDTGRFRGWLCNRCNTGIGMFKDDTAILEMAIRYLNNR